MKILVFSEVFWPEDFIINDLAAEWVQMGHEVDVVSQYPSYPSSYTYDGYENRGYRDEEWQGVTIHRFPFVEGYRDSKVKKVLNYGSFVSGGRRLVNKMEKEYDCTFVAQTGPLTVALPALHMRQKYGIPVNIWTCDIWPDAVWGYGVPQNAISRKALNHFIERVYSNCDRIFVSSKLFSQTIGRYTDQNCIYAPNWLRPVKNVRSTLRLPLDKINFTFAGNVSRYQNLINVIKGFTKARIADAQLNIVGDGSYLSEVKMAATSLNAHNVVFHGRRPYNEIYDILTQSDILVLPLMANSGIEKTEPYKIQSYLCAGKPILGVLNGAGREIIESERLGICTSPVDVEDIASGFCRMTDVVKGDNSEISKRSQRLLQGRFNKIDIIKRITENLSQRS